MPRDVMSLRRVTMSFDPPEITWHEGRFVILLMDDRLPCQPYMDGPFSASSNSYNIPYSLTSAPWMTAVGIFADSLCFCFINVFLKDIDEYKTAIISTKGTLCFLSFPWLLRIEFVLLINIFMNKIGYCFMFNYETREWPVYIYKVTYRRSWYAKAASGFSFRSNNWHILHIVSIPKNIKPIYIFTLFAEVESA